MERIIALFCLLLLNHCVLAESNGKPNFNKDELRMEWSEFSFILKPSALEGLGVFCYP